MRALLLEDSTSVARMLITFLREHGYAVERYAGVTGARAACNGYTFDLYVIDEGVQETELGGSASGLEFAQTLPPLSRVIVCSSNDCRARAESLGFTFIPKGEQFGERFAEVLRGLA